MPPFDVNALWQPKPIWKDQPAFIIGGGPSLKNFDFTQLAGKNVIGVNFAYKLGATIVPFVCFSDSAWFNQVQHELLRYYNAGGELVSCSTSLTDLNLPWIHKMQRIRDGIHLTDGAIGWNYSTGAVAINLALYFGANPIYLLGFDMQRKGYASHWHRHYAKVTDDASFERHKAGFATVVNELGKLENPPKVLNVTDGTSLLTGFETIDFAKFRKVLAGEPLEAPAPVVQKIATKVPTAVETKVPTTVPAPIIAKSITKAPKGVAKKKGGGGLNR